MFGTKPLAVSELLQSSNRTFCRNLLEDSHQPMSFVCQCQVIFTCTTEVNPQDYWEEDRHGGVW